LYPDATETNTSTDAICIPNAKPNRGHEDCHRVVTVHSLDTISTARVTAARAYLFDHAASHKMVEGPPRRPYKMVFVQPDNTHITTVGDSMARTSTISPRSEEQQAEGKASSIAHTTAGAIHPTSFSRRHYDTPSSSSAPEPLHRAVVDSFSKDGPSENESVMSDLSTTSFAMAGVVVVAEGPITFGSIDASICSVTVAHLEGVLQIGPLQAATPVCFRYTFNTGTPKFLKLTGHRFRPQRKIL